MAAGDRDDWHPSPLELERFLLGEVSTRQATPVLAHLLQGCEQCQARMEPMVSVMFGAGPKAPEPQQAGSEYDFPLFKALATARKYAAASAQTRVENRVEPASSAPAPNSLLAAAPAAFDQSGAEQDWNRCQRLIEICRALRYSDTETLVLTATLAVKMSERLPSGLHGTAALADLQAYALAELSNARRVIDDLVGAEADLAHSMERASQGTGSPLLLERLLDLRASLYIDQSRFKDARVLFDAVYAIRQREGDRHLMGRALISRGFAAVSCLEAEEGFQLLSQGLAMIDATRDPKLATSAIFNMIWALVECGRATQANTLFKHSQKLFSAHLERKDRIKYTWLEGRIAAAMKDSEHAELRLREAWAAFEEFKFPIYVALVSLDLAALWLRAGRTSEIMALIEETVAVFRSHGMSREAIAILLIVQEALTKQQATEALLHATAVELLRIKDPSNRRERVLG
jgi:hypothetical protein